MIRPLGWAILASVGIFWAVVEIVLLFEPPYFGLSRGEEALLVLIIAGASLWIVHRGVEQRSGNVS